MGVAYDAVSSPRSLQFSHFKVGKVNNFPYYKVGMIIRFMCMGIREVNENLLKINFFIWKVNVFLWVFLNKKKIVCFPFPDQWSD